MQIHEIHLGAGTLKLQLSSACSHLEKIRDVEPSGDGCKECVEMGDEWFHLRLCRVCGHVGCCDQSRNHHATQHFHQTQHEIIQSFQPDEDWMYCYPDDAFIELV